MTLRVMQLNLTLCRLLNFSKSTFQNILSGMLTVPKGLNPDQVNFYVCPDLDLNCLF